MFTQIVILLMVLACMVMVLLAIRQLTNFERFEDSEETMDLKHEVEEDGKVISHNNIFSTLVEAEPVEDDSEKEKHGHYHSNSHYKLNSKDPWSRKE